MALSQEVGSGSPLLLTLHQSCQEHSTPVSKAGLLAARALYEWTSAREGLKHNVWHPTTKQMRVFDSKPFPRQQHQRLCIRRCAKDGITKFGPAHMRHAFATLSSGSGHAAKVDQRVPSATQHHLGYALAFDELVGDVRADEPGDQDLRATQSVRPPPPKN